jgi:large subunit ribosomal protein L3
MKSVRIEGQRVVQSRRPIDVAGISKGHGYSGVIKRWSFAGFPGSHGTHEYFRHGGSIGNRSYPGRVRKGKKMAGHWGDEQVSIQNLRSLIFAEQDHADQGRGSGAKQGVVIVRLAAKG